SGRGNPAVAGERSGRGACRRVVGYLRPRDGCIPTQLWSNPPSGIASDRAAAALQRSGEGGRCGSPVNLKTMPFGLMVNGTAPFLKVSLMAPLIAPVMASPDMAAAVFVAATCRARTFRLSVLVVEEFGPPEPAAVHDQVRTAGRGFRLKPRE